MARKRNRKKKQVNTFSFPVPFAGVAILAASFALSYVWLGARCESLGSELKTLEKERAALEKRHANEACRWARVRSPENVEKALNDWNIVMGWPRRDQVVWLYDHDMQLEQVASVSGGRRGQRGSSMVGSGLVGAVMNE